MNDSPNKDDPASSAPSVRITTGARLHFGLLDTAPPFGGVGVMVDDPQTEVVVEPSGEFRCQEDPDSRVRSVAALVAASAGLPELPACHIRITARPPAHSGLGSGTQLAMAVAEALCRFIDHDVEADELAREIACRGERSAVGVHGYFCGGLIHEAPDGKSPINPVCERIELPPDWRVALFRPAASEPLISGESESNQFSRLSPVLDDVRQSLEATLLDHILPAAKAGDLSRFAAAVTEYNHRSGMLFESVQGGPYNGRPVAELVKTLTDHGARGVGQSSWGPSVFAWFATPEEADSFCQTLPTDIQPYCLTQPRNSGRNLQT